MAALATGYGQEAASSEVDCDQKLSQAEAEFTAGHFYGIPSILKDCLDGSRFTKEQLVRAYLVLCQSYLILDDPTAAGDNYLKLLKADPEYVPNEKDDPIDIVYLSKQYTATPIFTPHFYFGLNTSFFRTIYSISTEPYQVTSEHPLQIGIQGGGGLDWNINENISLCIEGAFANRGYERILTSGVNTDATNIQANQWWIDAPIYAKYSFSLNELIRPFGYAGVAVNYLLSESNTFSYTDNKSNGSQLVSEGPSESVTNRRTQFNYSWLIGGGLRYKVGKNFFYVDVRYMAGLSNVTNESKLYYEDPSKVNPQQVGNPNYYLTSNISRYHYLSDIFRIDNLSMSFGFVKPLYDPRKVKRARTKSVARSIRKEGGKGK